MTYSHTKIANLRKSIYQYRVLGTVHERLPLFSVLPSNWSHQYLNKWTFYEVLYSHSVGLFGGRAHSWFHEMHIYWGIGGNLLGVIYGQYLTMKTQEKLSIAEIDNYADDVHHRLSNGKLEHNYRSYQLTIARVSSASTNLKCNSLWNSLLWLRKH